MSNWYRDIMNLIETANMDNSNNSILSEAYITQEKKKEIAEKVIPILKKYGLKGSLSVKDLSVLTLTIKQGKIDFFSSMVQSSNRENYIEKQYIDDASARMFNGIAAEVIGELIEALNDGNHDNSDVQTDYFDVGWYSYIKIGSYDKPYKHIA